MSSWSVTHVSCMLMKHLSAYFPQTKSETYLLHILMVKKNISMSCRRVDRLVGFCLSHWVSKWCYWNGKHQELNLSIYDWILFRNAVRNLITTTVTLRESHSCCGLWKRRSNSGSVMKAAFIYKGHQRSTWPLFFWAEQIYSWRIPSCFYDIFFLFFFVDRGPIPNGQGCWENLLSGGYCGLLLCRLNRTSVI